MKSTKKIIIGLIAVMALLITIAGALAVEPSATYTPSTNPAPINQTQKNSFSALVANPDAMMLSYQWYVDDIPTGVSVQNNSANYTSSFEFDANGKSLGSHSVTVVVTGGATPLTKTWIVTVQEQEPQPESALTITSVKLNGKSSGKLSVSDLNEIKVEVSNDHDQKIEEITVTVSILDEDGDEIVDDETADIEKLSAGDEEEVELEFDLSEEDLEEEDYTIKVEVEGEDIDGTDFSDSLTLDVQVDREKDDLVILKAELEDSQVFCSANPQTSLKVKIKNIGENEQEGAKITVKNAELELNLQRANIDLEDYAGSDNDYEATFALNLENAKQGTYTLDVAVYSEDNDLMDSKEVELQVVCDNEASSEKDKESTEYYADQKLAAELQQKINAYKVMQESQAANQTFRENDSYVLLLGVLVALTFFAVTLSATYLLVKRK